MITTIDGKTFHLQVETEADDELVSALYVHGLHLRYAGPTSTPNGKGKGWKVTGAKLEIDYTSPHSIRAEAGRELLRCFSQIVGLGLREAAVHSHVGANATNPQSHEQLAASLEELKLMLQALSAEVIEQKGRLQKVVGAHGDSFDVEPPIVAKTNDA